MNGMAKGRPAGMGEPGQAVSSGAVQQDGQAQTAVGRQAADRDGSQHGGTDSRGCWLCQGGQCVSPSSCINDAFNREFSR